MSRPTQALVALVVAGLVSAACKTTEEKPEANARVAPEEAFRAERPAAGPPAEINLPKFEEATLKNGLRVYVAQVSALPIVDVRLVIGAGSAQEGASDAGLANLTFDMLDEGAGDMDGVAFADAAASLGAQVSVGAGRESGSASLQVLRRRLDDGVGLLALMAKKPRFDDDDYGRIKKQQLSALKARNGDPRAISADVFSEVTFGAKHPYGHPAAGTAASVEKLTTKDIKQFWARHAGPKNAALIFAGDITLEDAKTIATKHFGKWKSKAAPSKAPGDPSGGEGRLHVVDIPGTPQTVVRIGRPLIKRGDPDRWSLEILNRLLGGMFSSRLNMKLREEKQYTYGAYSAMSASRGVGPWFAGAGIKVEHTGAALEDFFGEFARVTSEPPSQEELDAAKDNLVKSFPANFETISAMSGAASELFIYGLPGDYFAKIPALVNAVTLDDVKKAAERALVKNEMRVVLVGDYSAFKDSLSKLELGEVVVVER